MKTNCHYSLSLLLLLAVAACTQDPLPFYPISPNQGQVAGQGEEKEPGDEPGNENGNDEPGNENGETPSIPTPSGEAVKYVDGYGDVAYLPAGFSVSTAADEQSIRTGLVVIGPDGSEFVWIPTTRTPLVSREFNSYFSGGDKLSNYKDETSLPAYRAMVASVDTYGGFYMGRYEASQGNGNVPVSKAVTASQSGRIWVQYSPQDATVACEKLYSDNPTVQGFFPWGSNWDTMLQWLVDSGNKTLDQVTRDSTSWGNYSDDSFSPNARGNYTGAYEQAKACNIYDLAGNNWEWTQERNGSNYVMRGGGYNLMGGACSGSRYPAALRDPLPGNNHHPNVCFRIGLFVI